MNITQIGNQSAYIIEHNGCRALQSYDQIVAVRSTNGNYYRTDHKWSVTTSKHINRFVGGRNEGTLIPQNVLDDWTNADFS